jgi:hypothetical protein
MISHHAVGLSSLKQIIVGGIIICIPFVAIILPVCHGSQEKVHYRMLLLSRENVIDTGLCVIECSLDIVIDVVKICDILMQ